MKIIKTVSAMAIALTILVTPALADDHKQAGCCKKAAKEGKTCDHDCCVKAAKDGKECSKCGGSGEIPKDETKKDEKKEEKK